MVDCSKSSVGLYSKLVDKVFCKNNKNWCRYVTLLSSKSILQGGVSTQKKQDWELALVFFVFEMCAQRVLFSRHE